MGRHSLADDRRAITYHYDVSNEFYRLFLGEEMVYSCAYFRSGDEDINEAQRNKLDYICRKLRLKPGEKFLDVGCGWGGLIIHAAKHYQVEALGITISQKQYHYAQEKIRKEGLTELCRVELKDYRELQGEEMFDKIASVGMFEHVGLKNLLLYFKQTRKLLKKDGLFLNHGITQEQKDTGRSAGTKFINRYIFPEGELTSISHVLEVMEKARFEVHDVESLRPHYAKTLRLWTLNLQSKKEEAIRLVGERTYRTWLIYLAGCAWGFEKGNINVYQVLASKHATKGFAPLPLTREDLYLSKPQAL